MQDGYLALAGLLAIAGSFVALLLFFDRKLRLRIKNEGLLRVAYLTIGGSLFCCGIYWPHIEGGFIFLFGLLLIGLSGRRINPRPD